MSYESEYIGKQVMLASSADIQLILYVTKVVEFVSCVPIVQNN